MNNQLIKDLGRLLNDSRIGFCDVRSDKRRIVGYSDLGNGDGVIIGRVVWASGNGSYFTITRDLHVTPDTLIESLRAIYANHPTRVLCDVMYCVKYDTKRNSMTLGVTNSSNLEQYDVTPRRMSAQLRAAIEYAVSKEHIKYKTEYCDTFISNFERAGGYAFVFI